MVSPYRNSGFTPQLIQLQVKVGDLSDGQTRRFPAGGVDLRVFLSRLPRRVRRASLR